MTEEFEDLDEDLALERIAYNLDIASMHANKKKNVAGLITIAGAWMEVASILSDTPRTKKGLPMGFAATEEENNEPRIIKHNSEGGSPLHKEPGELRERSNWYRSGRHRTKW
jgi:hypothetical protein